jgi:hypothetical protein
VLNPLDIGNGAGSVARVQILEMIESGAGFSLLKCGRE